MNPAAWEPGHNKDEYVLLCLNLSSRIWLWKATFASELVQFTVQSFLEKIPKPEIVGKTYCRGTEQSDIAEVIKGYRDVTLLLRTWNEISRLQDKATTYFKQPPTELRCTCGKWPACGAISCTSFGFNYRCKRTALKICWKMCAHKVFQQKQNGKQNKNRILLERTMKISDRLKLSDVRDDEQILQAAVKKRDF